MVPPAEAPADFGERAGRHLLGQIHADLARHHHAPRPAGRQQVSAAHIEVAAHHLQDVVDLDARAIGVGLHVPQHEGSEVQRHGSLVELLVGGNAVERAFEFPARARDAARHEFQHFVRNDDRGIAFQHRLVAAPEDAPPCLEVGELDVDHESAHQP